MRLEEEQKGGLWRRWKYYCYSIGCNSVLTIFIERVKGVKRKEVKWSNVYLSERDVADAKREEEELYGIIC